MLSIASPFRQDHRHGLWCTRLHDGFLSEGPVIDQHPSQGAEQQRAAWLYDLLQANVSQIIVCNPRKNALLNEGSKNDRIDARKLADLLRGNYLKPVYHGEHGLRMLKELSRTYLTISKDLVRVMNRLKALYRSWGIAYSGKSVYPRQPTRSLAEQDQRGWRAPAG